ncbi:nucleoside-diphosphate sugar epimerase [Cellulophaga sp. F20128]|nr:nucleoside-diphosphate sugar epimerase [Cellulophaga sp. F20128]MCK0157496.1 nucleoside-diphosphate sugar epimerase [Cellulophaga sp. F20128]
MKSNEKTAIILGATGLTGGILLQRLLAHKSYSKVLLFSRSSSGISHKKLEEHIIDMQQLLDYKSKFVANDVFCCIGTTKAKTPNKALYKNIDYGIPVAAAQLCKANHCNTFIVISALGANAGSSVFYNKVKGEMEQKVSEQRIPKLHILQPSLIAGKREEKRIGEWIGKVFMRLFRFLFVGRFKKYRSIHPKTIAEAMVWLANNNYDKIIIESDEIVQLVSDNNGRNRA